MNVLSIAAFHNNVVNVVYDETIFHVVLNISVVSLVNDKTTFELVLIISAVSVVNDEIIFDVVLKNIVVIAACLTIALLRQRKDKY